jgi:pimeloyl-ACP methyl ester carboxylesterase
MEAVRAFSTAREIALGVGTLYSLFAQEKINNELTVIVHGVAGSPVFWAQNSFPGWSREFQRDLGKKGVNNTDYLEHQWSGFDITGFGVLPFDFVAHYIATLSLHVSLSQATLIGYHSINVIAHSWGTMIANDALYYSAGTPVPASDYISMGSPMWEFAGKPSVLKGDWTDVYSDYDPVTWFRVPSPVIPTVLGFLPALVGVGIGQSAVRQFADNKHNLTNFLAINNNNANMMDGLFIEHTSYWNSALVQGIISNEID